MSSEGSNAAPSYRGKLCTTVLESVRLERWGKDALGRAPGQHVEAIETCRALSWVPASDLDMLNRASLAEAGREEYVDFWRRYTSRTRDSVLFGPFVSGAFRIFGMRPEGFLRWVGSAWNATTRNYGDIKFSAGSGFADLSLVEIPVAGRLTTVAASLEGSLHGVLDLCRHRGSIDVDESRLKNEGIVKLRVSWDGP